MSDRNTATVSVRPVIFRLPDGAAVRVRPIRSDDGSRLQDYLPRLWVGARHNRFLGAVSELPPREIARLAAMDRPGELALVAFAADDPGAAIIGEAIHVIAPE